jgi:hypothetical protein
LDGREVVLADRSLRLDLPAYLRVGEGQDARFEITPGQQPAEFFLVATARLQLPALAGEPAEANLRLVDGQAARFTWRLLAREAGLQRGVLWLTVAAQETGVPPEEIAVLARPVEIAVRSELPLRIGAGAGLALGCFGWVLAGRYRRWKCRIGWISSGQFVIKFI